MHHTNQGSREIPQGNASSLCELIPRTKFPFISIKTAETVLFPRKQEIEMQQQWTDRTHENTWKNKNHDIVFCHFHFVSEMLPFPRLPKQNFDSCLTHASVHGTCILHSAGSTNFCQARHLLLSSEFSKSTNSNPKVMHN